MYCTFRVIWLMKINHDYGIDDVVSTHTRFDFSSHEFGMQFPFCSRRETVRITRLKINRGDPVIMKSGN